MRIRDGSSDVCLSDLWRRVQAACEMRGNSTTLSRAGFCSARACSSISAAVSTQLPQQAPQPVRMVSSARPPQPAFAAWRMSLSVTPLQMHTYMVFRSEEHTSELQSLMRISYAVFCLKKKNIQLNQHTQ